MIREFRESDTDDVHTISMMSFDEYFHPGVFGYYRTQWPSGQLVYCGPDGRVIGFLSSCRVEGRKVRILLLGVLPEYRGREIGRMLLSELRRRAFLEGMISVSLEVRISNTDARRFYQRNGFHEIDILPGYYHDGGDAVVMSAPVLDNQ